MRKNLKYFNLILVFIIAMINNISIVKADAPLKYYISNQEAKYERNYWGYWNSGITKSTPIKVKRGDTITITVMFDNWPDAHYDMQLYSGKSTIRFDAGVFSPLKISQEEYSDFSMSDIKDIVGSLDEAVLEDNYDGSIQNRKLGSLAVSYNYYDKNSETCGDESCHYDYSESTATIKPGLNKLYQIKFKVLDDAKDGIYSIFTLSGEENKVSYSEGWVWDEGNVIYYQIGNDASNVGSTPTTTEKPSENAIPTNTPESKIQEDNPINATNIYMYLLVFLSGAILVIICIIVAIKFKSKKSPSIEEINQKTE